MKTKGWVWYQEGVDWEPGSPADISGIGTGHEKGEDTDVVLYDAQGNPVVTRSLYKRIGYR